MRAGRAEPDLADLARRPELVGHAEGVPDEVAPDGTLEALGLQLQPVHAASVAGRDRRAGRTIDAPAEPRRSRCSASSPSSSASSSAPRSWPASQARSRRSTSRRRRPPRPGPGADEIDLVAVMDGAEFASARGRVPRRAGRSAGTPASTWTCARQRSTRTGASLEVRTVFGGTRVVVAPGVPVRVTGPAVFGGVMNSTGAPEPSPDDPGAGDHGLHAVRRAAGHRVGARRGDPGMGRRAGARAGRRGARRARGAGPRRRRGHGSGLIALHAGSPERPRP